MYTPSHSDTSSVRHRFEHSWHVDETSRLFGDNLDENETPARPLGTKKDLSVRGNRHVRAILMKYLETRKEA